MVERRADHGVEVFGKGDVAPNFVPQAASANGKDIVFLPVLSFVNKERKHALGFRFFLLFGHVYFFRLYAFDRLSFHIEGDLLHLLVKNLKHFIVAQACQIFAQLALYRAENGALGEYRLVFVRSGLGGIKHPGEDEGRYDRHHQGEL